MKIAFVGPGRWGCTAASAARMAGHEVTLFGLPADIEKLQESGKVPFTDFLIEAEVELRVSDDSLPEHEIVFFTVDGQHLKGAWQQWGKAVHGIVAVAVKTIDVEDGKLILPVGLIEHEAVVYFASGAFPEGLLRGSPAIGTVYGPDDLTSKVREVFPGNLLRVYTSTDMVEGQVGSALKNITALASGIAKGLGYDEMTRAAIVGRGIREIKRFACHFGARADSFEAGSVVVIDTIGTCLSDSSHNTCAGVRIAEGTSVDELESERGTIEGIRTLRILEMIPGALKDMPIAAAVYKILFDGVAPQAALLELMNRPITV